MKNKVIWTMCILLCITMLSGCWDKVEIEQRAIINSMIIEVGQNHTEASAMISQSGIKSKGIKVTFGILIPHSQGQGEDMGYSRVIQGNSLTQVLSLLGEETSRVPFYGQIRLLILNKEFLKDREGFKSLIDFIERDASTNTNMRVVVTENTAEEITDVAPKLESSTTDHIRGILDNAEHLSGTVSISFENLINKLRDEDGSAALPMLEAMKDNQTFKIDKLCLIRDFTYLGEINSQRVKDYKIITDTFNTGRQQLEFEDTMLSIYIDSCHAKKKLTDSQEGLRFSVSIEAEGDVDQYDFSKSLMNSEAIRRVEEAMEKQMEKELKDTLEYFQKSIGYDYLGFQEYMKKYKPSEYKRYSSDWDQAFKNAEIECNATFHIRRIGTTN